MRQFLAFALLLHASFAGAPAFAQSLAAVPSPDIAADERSVEYRAAYGLFDAGAPDAFAHRIHYQQSLGEDWRIRVIVQQGKRGDAPLKTQTLGIQFFTQFVESEENGGWDSGLRFDGFIPLKDGRSGRARVVWLNSFDFAPSWQVRSNLLLGREFGDNAQDGISLELREEATYRLSDDVRIGAQLFSNLNTTAHFGTFDEQRRQIGPILRWKATKALRLDASILIGVSRAAADADFRIFAAYGF